MIMDKNNSDNNDDDDDDDDNKNGNNDNGNSNNDNNNNNNNNANNISNNEKIWKLKTKTIPVVIGALSMMNVLLIKSLITHHYRKCRKWYSQVLLTYYRSAANVS